MGASLAEWTRKVHRFGARRAGSEHELEGRVVTRAGTRTTRPDAATAAIVLGAARWAEIKIAHLYGLKPRVTIEAAVA